jgi:hypothetical protein
MGLRLLVLTQASSAAENTRTLNALRGIHKPATTVAKTVLTPTPINALRAKLEKTGRNGGLA